MSNFSFLFEGDTNTFRPKSKISGTVKCFNKSINDVVIRLLYIAKGTFTYEERFYAKKAIIMEKRLVNNAHRNLMDGVLVDFILPESPWSYIGHNFSVSWYIDIEPFQPIYMKFVNQLILRKTKEEFIFFMHPKLK